MFTSDSIRAAARLLMSAAIIYAAPLNAQVSTGTFPTREQVQAPVPQTAPPPSQINVEGSRAFRETRCAFEHSAQKVKVDRVRFTGVERGALHPQIASVLSRISAPAEVQPLSVICDLRDTANQALRDAGFIASVQIPPQQIDSGEVSLVVITARLIDIKVVGQPNPYTGLIASRAERLRNMDPFNQADAERILLLAGDVPGLDVQLSLSPAGTVPGEVVGSLSVVYSPFNVVANVQNYGSERLGRETGFARLEVFGLTGLADVTYVAGSTTFDFDEQQVVQAGHSFGFGADGTRLQGDFTYAWSQPDLGALDIRSRSMVASVALTSPVVRGATRNVTVSAGLDVIEQKTRLFFGDTPLPLNRDKLRVAFARIQGSVVDPDPKGYGYALSAGLELRRGLDIFGATQRGAISEGYTPSKLDGDPEATVARFDLDAQAGLGSLFSLSSSVRAQRASDPLLNFEEFSVGSFTVGRGYDPGANGGDSAFAARNELRMHAFRDRRVAAELYGFYDYAWLWNLDRRDRSEEKRVLRSAGIGARVSLPPNLLLDVSYAHPFDRALTEDDRRPSDRLLLSLTAQFAPRAR